MSNGLSHENEKILNDDRIILADYKNATVNATENIRSTAKEKNVQSTNTSETRWNMTKSENNTLNMSNDKKSLLQKSNMMSESTEELQQSILEPVGSSNSNGTNSGAGLAGNGTNMAEENHTLPQMENKVTPIITMNAISNLTNSSEKPSQKQNSLNKEAIANSTASGITTAANAASNSSDPNLAMDMLKMNTSKKAESDKFDFSMNNSYSKEPEQQRNETLLPKNDKKALLSDPHANLSDHTPLPLNSSKLSKPIENVKNKRTSNENASLLVAGIQEFPILGIEADNLKSKGDVLNVTKDKNSAINEKPSNFSMESQETTVEKKATRNVKKQGGKRLENKIIKKSLTNSKTSGMLSNEQNSGNSTFASLPKLYYLNYCMFALLSIAAVFIWRKRRRNSHSMRGRNIPYENLKMKTRGNRDIWDGFQDEESPALRPITRSNIDSMQRSPFAQPTTANADIFSDMDMVPIVQRRASTDDSTFAGTFWNGPTNLNPFTIDNEYTEENGKENSS